ncbi:MAG: YidC/Oxa1 family insertase periplasmic-domain containing protein [Phycisphaerae bacterium]
MKRSKTSWALMIIGAVGLAAILISQAFMKKDDATIQQPDGVNVTATQPVETQPATATAVAADTPSDTDETTTTGTAPAPSPDVEGSMQSFDNKLAAEQVHWLGSLDPRSGYKVRLEMTSRGAALRTVKLSEYFATVEDEDAYEDFGSEEAYQKAVAERKDLKGHYSVLNPMTYDGRNVSSYQTTQLSFMHEGRRVDWPLGQANWRLRKSTFGQTEDQTQTAEYELTIHRGKSLATARKFLTVVKTYTVKKNSYSVEMKLRVINHTDQDLQASVDQLGPTGLAREGVRNDARTAAYGNYQGESEEVDVALKRYGDLEKLSASPNIIGMTDSEESPTLWIGASNKFFGSMIYLYPPENAPTMVPVEYNAKYYVQALRESPTSKNFAAGIMVGKNVDGGIWQPLKVRPGEDSARELKFDVFVGPKDRDLFTDADKEAHNPLYDKLNYIGTIDFGGCFCTFTPLSLFMMQALSILSYVALGNYGIAIIMLVFIVRLILHPLTKKGQVSMMKMQKLSPKINKIKEKYADDKDTQMREIQNVYRQAGATPILGCLPMLLQMPIWVALWTALNNAIELRHAAFLPVWINNLAAPDGLFTWDAPINIPFLAQMTGPIYGLNLLPILLGLAMFLQSKYNPQMAQAATGPGGSDKDEQARQQQKMMQYFMPAFMLLIFYNAPSGLTLYIMSSTTAGLLEQYYIRKHIREKEEEENSGETIVKAPGKKARGSRPKKPKGPFWTKRG